jgi:hypothetical protein
MAIRSLVVTRFRLEPLEPLELLDRLASLESLTGFSVRLGWRGRRQAGAIRVETRNSP